MPDPRASRSGPLALGLVLALVGLLVLISPAAQAQIVHEKPGQVKAANRRALREAQRTESPYKDSHLDVTPDRLRRGASTQPAPEGSTEFHYKNGNAPNDKPPGFLGLRRKKDALKNSRKNSPEKK